MRDARIARNLKTGRTHQRKNAFLKLSSISRTLMEIPIATWLTRIAINAALMTFGKNP